METEIWKAHPDIPEIEVSSLGRVRTLDRLVWNGRGKWLMKGHVLKQSGTKDGYLKVHISINGKQDMKRVHRLVAETFIPNPDNLPQVNHKDCDRKNNNVENLEFCTASYNIKYREKFGKAENRPVFAINLSTLEVAKFRSQSEASCILGVNRPHINDVIQGRRKTTGGFWFTNDDANVDDIINRKLREIGKTRIMINMEGQP